MVDSNPIYDPLSNQPESLRPFNFFLLLAVIFSIALPFQPLQAQNSPQCADFQDLDKEFRKAFDHGEIILRQELAAQLVQLDEECQNLPASDRIWEVLHLQLVSDSMARISNAQSLAYNTQQGDSAAIIRNLAMESKLDLIAGEMESAEAGYIKCTNWYLNRKQMAPYITHQTNLMRVYAYQSEFGKLLEGSLEGLETLKALGQNDTVQRNGEGIFHLLASYAQINTDQFHESLEHGRASANAYRQTGNKAQLSTTLSQMGGVFLELENSDSAAYYLEASLDYADTSNAKGWVAYGMANYSLAALYKDLNNTEKALRHARISVRASEFSGKGDSYYSSRLLEGYLMIGSDNDGAIEVLQGCFEFYQNGHRYEMLLPICRSLAQTYLKQGKEEDATRFMDRAFDYKDSLFSDELAVSTQNARIRFETKQKEEQILAQDRELDQANALAAAQNRFLWGIGIGLGLALLLGGLALLAFVQRSRANRLLAAQKAEIEEQNEAKALLLKEIHHRVKNNLQVVSSLLEMQIRGTDDNQSRAIAREGQSRVHSMALIHQHLYQNENLLIDFGNFCTHLVNDIEAIYKPEEEIKKQIDTQDIRFDIDTAIPLGLILNELITNAFKYGIPGSKQKELSVSLRRENDEFYILEVADFGKGLPTDIDLSKTRSLGLRLVRRLARQLKGRLEHRNDNGCTFTIWFQDTRERLQAH